MNNKFLKKEKLKSKKDINTLFNQGKIINIFPLTTIYSEKEVKNNIPINMGISIPKKKIKLAVNRNLLKRRIREAYRLNNDALKRALINSEKELNVMFIYNSKQISSYDEIEGKIKVILTRLTELK